MSIHINLDELLKPDSLETFLGLVEHGGIVIVRRDDEEIVAMIPMIAYRKHDASIEAVSELLGGERGDELLAEEG